MGIKQSKRSVDITTATTKAESEAIGEGEGKLEKIPEIDAKVTTNGTVHTEIEFADKDEAAIEAGKNLPEASDIKENGVAESEEPKTPDGEVSSPEGGDVANESTSATEKTPETNEEKKVEETPENKKNKEKNKKKKWSFRSISFSKKDKSKPGKDSDKNGDVIEVAEENAEGNVASPTTDGAKTEEKETVDKTLTNGDATTEELTKSVENVESGKTIEEPAPVTEPTPAIAEEEPATKVEEPSVAVETPVAEPVKEIPVESTPPVQEVVVEPPQPIEEPKPVENPVVVETKEVRSEEVPPPLPTSSPPSPVTVFAESTKADALPVDQILKSESPIETIPEPLTTTPVTETTPQVTSTPITQQESEHSLTPIVESKESVAPTESASTPVIEQQESAPALVDSPIDSSVVEQHEEMSCPKPVTETAPENVTLDNTELPPPANPEPSLQSPIVEEVCSIQEKPITEVVTSEPVQAQEESVVTSEPPSTEITNKSEIINEPPAPILEQQILPPVPDEIVDIKEDCPPPPISSSNDNIPVVSEIVSHADSLPDVSSESLPSLPEPISESLPEPMSLPPVESVPEPIATEEPLPDPPSTVDQTSEPSPVSEIPTIPIQPPPVVLTNGTSNGLPSSPISNDVCLPTKEEPLKQVPEICNEIRQEEGDVKPCETVAESTVPALEE